MITLNNSDLARIEALAHARNDTKVGVIPTRRIDERHGDLELNILGLKGEFAVARYLGIPIESVDHAVSLRGRRWPHDLSYAGATIEVKTNSYPGGTLYFNEYFKADYAVLVVPGTNGAMRIVGYISRGEFHDKCNITDYGHGKRLAVVQWALRPIEELKQMAQGRMF